MAAKRKARTGVSKKRTGSKKAALPISQDDEERVTLTYSAKSGAYPRPPLSVKGSYPRKAYEEAFLAVARKHQRTLKGSRYTIKVPKSDIEKSRHIRIAYPDRDADPSRLSK